MEQAIEAGEYVTGEEEVHVDEVLLRSSFIIIIINFLVITLTCKP